MDKIETIEELVNNMLVQKSHVDVADVIKSWIRSRLKELPTGSIKGRKWHI